MDVAVVAAPADAARRLAAVREWWRERHPPPSLAQRLDVAYTAAIVGAIFGAMAYGTASSALAQVVTPHWLAAYGPSLALLALLLTAHWGAYQGPVVFAVADVAFLLGAPLRRRALAARRLVLSLAIGAVVGVVAAAVLIVGLAGEGRGIATVDAAGIVVGVAELGVLAVAGAWAVEQSARWERAVWRATWPGAVAAVALAAVQPTAGVGSTGWLAALIVLTLAAAVAAVAAVRGCGDCPAERHLRRAEARASAVASLASFDARTARRALETVVFRDVGRRGAGLGRVRDARLAVPWRDAAAALRTPGRVIEGAALAGAGTVLCVLNPDRPVTLAMATLVVYFGASRLLWPLRSDLDAPARVRVLLRPRIGRVLLAHTLVPVVVTTSAAVLGAAGCALAGALPEPGAAALLAVAGAPMVTCCAAMSARRGGRLPPSVLATAVAGDPSGGAGALLAWFTLWPTVAATLAAVPILLASSAGPGAAVLAASWIAIATRILVRLLDRDVTDR